MIKSFLTGMRQASGSWKMILLLLGANILFALPLAVPIFLLMAQTAGGTVFAERLYDDNLNAIWFSDLINERFAQASPVTLALQVAAMLVVVGSAYLLVNTLFAGGILEVYTSSDGRFTMRKFWAGCGAYFWRFFRLTLIAAIFYAIVVGGYALVRWAINKVDEKAAAEQPGALVGFAALLVLLLLISVVNMVLDYARIGAVINERRRMFRETFKAARLALRHFARTFGLYVIIGVAGLILFSFVFWLRSLVHQTSLGGVILAVAVGQLAIASRMWTRLTYYSAQINLYRSIAPVQAPEVAESAEAASSGSS
ncbi:MAG TPA: hypothetical protein VJH03_11570 [Blastocatellia bacterium]|nr:hypothetical protein [Blastocatellia bacterium]